MLIDNVAPIDANQKSELPSDPYRVIRVSLAGNDSLQSADLTALHPLITSRQD